MCYAELGVLGRDHCLGHPGSFIFQFLCTNKFISCEPLRSSFVCDSSVVRKHVKSPFYSSTSNTLMSFDIMHNDLWTSPVLSTARHKYYVLFLDDYSDFLWTFFIRKKSQDLPIFSSLHTLITTRFG